MFAVVSRKVYLCVLLAIIILFSVTVGIVSVNVNTATPVFDHTVVIDAGHGGFDGGVVGASGETCEREINLDIAKCLKSYFETVNCKVIMTRTNSNGLYNAFSSNKKKDDMQRRQEIINSARPDVVISIHQNGYVLSNQRGIGTFFNPKNPSAEKLANYIQSKFQQNIEYARQSALAGDYFILNCSPYTSVLVECGFLTNPEEEKLLITKDYQQKICYQIFSSIVGFWIEEKFL